MFINDCGVEFACRRIGVFVGLAYPKHDFVFSCISIRFKTNVFNKKCFLEFVFSPVRTREGSFASAYPPMLRYQTSMTLFTDPWVPFYGRLTYSRMLLFTALKYLVHIPSYERGRRPSEFSLNMKIFSS